MATATANPEISTPVNSWGSNSSVSTVATPSTTTSTATQSNASGTTTSTTTESNASGTAGSVNASNGNANASNGNANGSRGNIMTGTLPDHFLRLDPSQCMAGMPGVGVIPGGYGSMPFMPTYYQKGGILSVTVAQAKLAKNYGLARMDPYCRLRIGHSVFETPTAYNGAKNPRWNKLIQCPIPEGVNQVYFEIFDECSFSPDERIAWGMVPIKDEVFAGESLDDWYCLSGKQGDDKEGMINVVFHYRERRLPMAAPMQMYGQSPMVMYPQPVMYGYPPMVGPQGVIVQQSGQLPQQQQQIVSPQQQQLQQQQQQPPQPIQIPEQDVKNLKDMFPDMDEEIIKSVIQASGGNMDTAVSNLLSMTT